MKKILAVLVIAGMFIVSQAGACDSNYDCGIGGTCIKSDNSMYGNCVNRYGAEKKRGNDRYYEDDGDVEEPRYTNKECTSRYDCGIGGKCIKIGSSIYGSCTK